MITDNIGYMFLRLLRAWVYVLRAFYFLNHELQININLFTLLQSHFCFQLLFIARQFPLQEILFLLSFNIYFKRYFNSTQFYVLFVS
jgi:hypothetical protein